MPTSVFRELPNRFVEGISLFRGAKKRGRWVGLDLGSHSIKLAELEQTATGLRVFKIAIEELPVSLDSQAVDRTDWLRRVVEGFEAREVHIALSGPEVVFRRIQVPPMSRRELPEAVKWQVKDQVPFPIQEAVMDFRSIGEVWDNDLKKQDLLVGVASRAFVEGLVSMVERSGLRVASLSPAAYVLWRSAEMQIAEVAKTGSVALMEIGAETTQVAIVKDGNLRMAREMPIGSESITAALVGETVSDEGIVSIDRSQAEVLKRRYGVLGGGAEGMTEEGALPSHIASLMGPVLESLLTEVSRFLDFYKVQMEEGVVSHLLLCGGGANLKSIQPFLADGLGVTVETLNPLASITDRVQPLGAEEIAESGPRLAVAIGLALDHGQGLNLLPAKAQRGSGLEVSRDVWLMAARAAAGVAIALYLGLQAGVVIFQRQVRAQQAEWARLEPSYTRYLEVTLARKKLEVVFGRLERFLSQQPVWDGVLKELGALMPPVVEIDELAVTGNGKGAGRGPLTIRLKGWVISGGVSADGSIGPLVEEMNRSIFFREVEVVGSEVRSGDTGKTYFQIEGLLQ